MIYSTWNLLFLQNILFSAVHCLFLFSQQFQDPLYESIADEKESHHLNEVVRVKSFYFYIYMVYM